MRKSKKAQWEVCSFLGLRKSEAAEIRRAEVCENTVPDSYCDYIRNFNWKSFGPIIVQSANFFCINTPFTIENQVYGTCQNYNSKTKYNFQSATQPLLNWPGKRLLCTCWILNDRYYFYVITRCFVKICSYELYFKVFQGCLSSKLRATLRNWKVGYVW